MTKDRDMEQKYIKTMLENNLFAAVYPKDKSRESAGKLVDMIDAAVGVAKFIDDQGNQVWGAIVDKVKVAQKQVQMGEKNDSQLQNESVSLS